jgi:aldose sugar dehydrogenase
MLAKVPLYIGEFGITKNETFTSYPVDINQVQLNLFLKKFREVEPWGWAYWRWNLYPDRHPNDNLITVMSNGTVQTTKYFEYLKEAISNYYNSNYYANDGGGVLSNRTSGLSLYDLSRASSFIKAEYLDVNGAVILGNATSNVTIASDGIGYYQKFKRGAIYWTPSIGPHELHDSIYELWSSLGAEKGPLGYPIADTKATPDKDGYYSTFQDGAIYWTPYVGTHEIHGAIYNKWRDLGLERSSLGYPVSNELPVPGNGAINYFQGGSLWWNPHTGAYLVHSKDLSEYIKSNSTILLSRQNQSAMGNTTTTTTTTTSRNSGLVAQAQAIVYGLRFPTSFAFLGKDDILVLEKDQGTVRRIINNTLQPKPLLDVNVATKGERGMLGLAVLKHKNGPSYVFLYYTEAHSQDGEDVTTSREPIGNRLYRYELTENNTKLINPVLLLDIPTTPAGVHNGGRVLIGPDQNLYLVVGDLFTHRTQAQNFKNGTSADGTSVIYRIKLDGKAPADNPLGTSEPLNKFYAYGIRNSFGIDFDPVTGKLWDTENGVDHNDEINLVEPGFNSGWRSIQGLAKDDPHFDPKNDLVNFGLKGKYRDPEFVWNQTVGVTAIKFLNTDRLGKQYQNDLFVGDIYGNIYHFKLNQQRSGLMLDGALADKEANSPAEKEQAVIAKLGGVTDIQVGPDGYLYVSSIRSYYPTINDQGTIYKLLPAKH